MSDSLLDNLLNDSQTSYLKKTCPSLFDGSGTPKFSYNSSVSGDRKSLSSWSNFSAVSFNEIVDSLRFLRLEISSQ